MTAYYGLPNTSGGNFSFGGHQVDVGAWHIDVKKLVDQMDRL